MPSNSFFVLSISESFGIFSIAIAFVYDSYFLIPKGLYVLKKQAKSIYDPIKVAIIDV